MYWLVLDTMFPNTCVFSRRLQVCSLEFDRKDIIMNKLLATTLESRIHVFDMRTQNDKHGGFPCTTEKAHNSTVWLGRHLPQNREVFMTCGGAGSMYLWK